MVAGLGGGCGVADVLFGDYDFVGRLPMAWPGGMVGGDGEGSSDVLFPCGYGLGVG